MSFLGVAENLVESVREACLELAFQIYSRISESLYGAVACVED